MVKIDSVSTYGPKGTERSRKKDKGTFSATSGLGSSSSPSGPSAMGDGFVPSGVISVSQLMQLQEVADKFEGYRDSIQYGDAILKTLETLQMEMLSGQISEKSLKYIVDTLEQKPAQPDDPQLREVLDMVEQRARIELAKIEMSRTG